MAEELMPSEYYASKLADRKPYEDRAKLIATLTIPYIYRDDNDDGATEMAESNNQSYGGHLANTLKAKMGMALLPPSSSSFRLSPNAEELEALTQGSADNKAKVYATLSGATNRINTELEDQQIRSSLFDIILQLMLVGSTLVEKKNKKGTIKHDLNSFVVDLDSTGEPIRFCFVETLKVLPKGVTAAKEKDEYELYTQGAMDKLTGKWVVTQEIEGDYVGQEANYKDYDSMPYRYLGWTWMKGDKYHRPYAEDYYKDLEQLDKLSKLLTDGSIISAKQIIFVDQRGGRTRKEDVANSNNGDVVDGRADDVTTFKNEKNFDFQVAKEEKAELKRDLAKAFLMSESVTRDAERVTAEEIRIMAQELESSNLAGIYSKLSLQWSKWIIQKIMVELSIKFDAINVSVITGLDALGRSQEARKLDGVLQRAEALGLRHWFNDEELLSRYLSYDGVDSTGLLKTPAQVAEETKAKQTQMAQQQGAEAMATSAGQTAGQNAVNQAIPPQ